MMGHFQKNPKLQLITYPLDQRGHGNPRSCLLASVRSAKRRLLTEDMLSALPKETTHQQGPGPSLKMPLLKGKPKGTMGLSCLYHHQGASNDLKGKNKGLDFGHLCVHQRTAKRRAIGTNRKQNRTKQLDYILKKDKSGSVLICIHELTTGRRVIATLARIRLKDFS